MRKAIPANTLSLYTYRLSFGRAESGVTLWSATGFVYLKDDFYYLITNGHNITGVNPFSNSRMKSVHAGIPDLVSSKVKFQPNGFKGYFGHMDFAYPLYENDTPLWYIHPDHDYSVDVVALPLNPVDEVEEQFKMFPINQYDFDSFDAEVGEEVFVLGYPLNIHGGLELAIWKRATIATEPRLDFKKLPMLLIDTATRSGMSGAPVICQRSGWNNIRGKLTGKENLGMLRDFLGVYSGRLGAENQMEAQLGIVWKKQVIDEIIDGKKISDLAFQRVC
jgi:hypothetical protein